MPQEAIDASCFSPDTQEFVALLSKYAVRYLIVGGEAVIFYGYARLTGDVDFFFDSSDENARRLYEALDEFWSGDIPGIESCEELQEEGLVLQFGVPPNRIDLVSRIDGVSFSDAWEGKKDVGVESEKGSFVIYFISLTDLIKNKEAAGRPKDMDDLEFLRKAAED